MRVVKHLNNKNIYPFGIHALKTVLSQLDEKKNISKELQLLKCYLAAVFYCFYKPMYYEYIVQDQLVHLHRYASITISKKKG